jgi:hypothetical protein
LAGLVTDLRLRGPSSRPHLVRGSGLGMRRGLGSARYPYPYPYPYPCP